MTRCLSLVILLLLGACAGRDEPRSAQDAMAASHATNAREQGVYVYPAGCYDAAGRPLRPDPACQPAGPTRVRGRRGPAADPVLAPGSINLPSTPVPVPGGIGVLR